MKKLLMAIVGISLALYAIYAIAQFNPPAIAAYVSSDGINWSPLSGGSGTAAGQPPPAYAIYASCNGNQWCPWAGSSGGGGDTITSPNSTLTVGGTSSATTLDFNLAHSNTWTANQAITGSLTATQVFAGAASNLVLTQAGTSGYNIVTFNGQTAAGANNIGLVANAITANDPNLYFDVPSTGKEIFRSAGTAVGSVDTGGDFNGNGLYTSAIATVATATTIAPTGSHVNLTGTTAIATITTPTVLSSTIGACITFYPASTVATTTAGNIEAVYSLVGGKAYQGCWNGTKWYFIGSGI